MLIRFSSIGNKIYQNDISYTLWQGIYLISWPEKTYGSPENNIIYRNNFENCGHYKFLNNGYYGIMISSAYNNSIYQNNFINNMPFSQACDVSNNIFYNITNLNGNYWDNYSYEDINGDGIGDTPYKINCGNNQDPYPLMNPVDI